MSDYESYLYRQEMMTIEFKSALYFHTRYQKRKCKIPELVLKQVCLHFKVYINYEMLYTSKELHHIIPGKVLKLITSFYGEIGDNTTRTIYKTQRRLTEGD